MDSTGIIQFLLIILTIAVVAGFASTAYYLAEIRRTLNRPASPRAPATPEEPSDPTGSMPLPLSDIDPRSTGSLEESLNAISERYGLSSFTLATVDGLLIGSTRPGAEDEAARYSYLYTQGKLHDEAGVELLGVPHHGETVVGIAHLSEHLSAEQMSTLEQDIQDTLQHWV
ncbi:MAG: hypothetical protein XE10_0656 [Methanoculleus marisnigri]|jgi:hypothetical protein|uniref:Uncharacterized protein n=1 Tax=Methanoculleus marisnigri TaxID=2198 RepID=A0A101GR66_9EURY|nr:hypothetical protein [Methanoculleus marisnigri]KUK63121.1 MAG: hypothetical protein XD82_0506 [Methanoculleus marisnigri]KUL02576.1 MAG: hypothetical protein XE10_0656 [Methanoculleus marisnigri]